MPWYSRTIRWLRVRWLESALSLLMLGIIGWMAVVGYGFKPAPIPTPAPTATPLVAQFSGEVAYAHVLTQTGFGARPTGSDASLRTAEFIGSSLRAEMWEVRTEEFTYRGVAGRNVIAVKGEGPVVILGAHYDTRRRADRDQAPESRTEPVMGANDGASGVAVLLELGRVLDVAATGKQVWLVFFDAEDNGGLDGWEFIAGSQFMAGHLEIVPEFVVIVDMIGDADQQIFKEQNSTTELQDRVWAVAEALGYDSYFIPEFKYSLLDDHTPFLQRGIPAIDIIDFDYPYWHTTQDTADKVAPASLERVGRVLQTLLEGN